jgi:hypothetical protein
MLDVDVRDPPRAVRCEQRREAVVVAHHHGVGELAAQRLDLDAICDRLKVAHRAPPRSGRLREIAAASACDRGYQEC